MKKYVINELFSDGHERFAVIKDVEQDIKLNVHFLQYDEYPEYGGVSEKKKIGDILEGNLFIDLVVTSEKTNKELFFYQNIKGSSHIEAIAEVSQIIDEYAVYALSSLSDDNIRIEFERAVNYDIGERIFIIGSLEIAET